MDAETLNVLTPRDEDELSGVVRQAAERRIPIEIRGNGSKSGIGRPLQVGGIVSTAAMSGITLYEPTELVMSAKAGTPISDIEAALAERRQMLAFEPIDLGPLNGGAMDAGTIGAAFLTNMSGSRRISAGAARDHLLGLRAVNGRGEVFKSGGRVMKNVTGYDLCRALAGSWGTLAVASEVTFKVLPVAEETRTLVLSGLHDDIAVEVLCQAMGTPYEVTGTLHLQAPLARRLDNPRLRSDGLAITALRLENFSSFVDYRAKQLVDLLKPYGEVLHLDHETSLAFWGECRRLSFLGGSRDPVWRISTAPVRGPQVVKALTTYTPCKIAYDWSGGLIWAEVPQTADASAADVRRVVAVHGGHATLMRADTTVRAAVDVLQPLEPAIQRLSRSIKSTFDPAGILNPGRMYLET